MEICKVSFQNQEEDRKTNSRDKIDYGKISGCFHFIKDIEDR